MCGQSGCPIFFVDRCFVVGTHKGGDKKNYGTLISKDEIQNIRKWTDDKTVRIFEGEGNHNSGGNGSQDLKEVEDERDYYKKMYEQQKDRCQDLEKKLFVLVQLSKKNEKEIDRLKEIIKRNEPLDPSVSELQKKLKQQNQKIDSFEVVLADKEAEIQAYRGKIEELRQELEKEKAKKPLQQPLMQVRGDTYEEVTGKLSNIPSRGSVQRLSITN